MKSSILFPYRIGDDNRNAFAFAVEMARRSNTDILALTSMELPRHIMQNKNKREDAVLSKKNEIYCDLLEMKGYYHGKFNQWSVFDDVKIHVKLVDNDINGAICSSIKDHTDLVIVLQLKSFSGTGLYEEIFSDASESNATLFLFPGNYEFSESPPNLIGVMFDQQKRASFIKLLHATKIFDLPEDKDDFREEMIMQQAV
jgi:hypothetical protein